MFLQTTFLNLYIVTSYPMKKQRRIQTATWSGLAIPVVLVLLALYADMNAVFIACALLSWLTGLAIPSETNKERLKYVFEISGATVLALFVIMIFSGSWLAAALIAFSAGGAAAGLWTRLLVSRAQNSRALTAGTAYLVLAAAVMVWFLPQAERRDTSEYVREPAPSFELLTLSGDTLRSEELRGKVVLFDFWASWCGPCIRQFPNIEKIAARYKDDPDVYVAAVNTSWNNTMEDARKFRDNHPLEMRVLYDPGGRLTGALGIRSIPHTLLIDKKGIIRIRHGGFIPGIDFASVMNGHIEDMLKE